MTTENKETAVISPENEKEGQNEAKNDDLQLVEELANVVTIDDVKDQIKKEILSELNIAKLVRNTLKDITKNSIRIKEKEEIVKETVKEVKKDAIPQMDFSTFFKK